MSPKIKLSHNIPFEVQEEIIKRFPVKSLIRFRSVSKAWKSLIDSPEFIATHSFLHHAHSHRLLVRYKDLHETDQKKYVCIVDDDTFPQHKFAPAIPLFVELLKDSKIVGSSHGLFCFSGYYQDSRHKVRKKMAVIWNPSIRKYIAINLPVYSYEYDKVIGFGVCPVTGDPKILMTSKWPFHNPEQGMIFTLSSGAWRRSTIKKTRELVYLNYPQVVIDRFIYWLVHEKIGTDDGGSRNVLMITSFDLTNDEFGEVCLPDTLAINGALNFSVLKVREALGFVQGYINFNKRSYDVWLMVDDDGVLKSFVKLFTIDEPGVSLCIYEVLGFRKTDEPILEVQKDSDSFSELAAVAFYEPFSQHIDYPVISGSVFSFSVFSYTKTLLLLNQPRV